MKNNEQVRYRFGELIRTVRERKGLTMREVANKAEVSESLISQIERDKVSPSLDTLLTIAEVLQIDLEYLFQDFKKTKKVSIVRSDDRNAMVLKQIRYEQLSSFSSPNEKHAIEAFILTIKSGQEKGDFEYGHPGRELGFILSGKGRLHYGTETYDLNEGDSISFTSDIPHTLKNTGNDDLKAIWVITPPRLFT